MVTESYPYVVAVFTASPRTIGAAPSGYFSSRSLPCHQPAKWNGMKLVPGPTRGVTSALTLMRAPVGVDTQTQSQYLMPRLPASSGLISTKFSCWSSASHGLERVSSPPPSYSTRRPEVSTIGYFSATLSCTAFCCTVLYSVGRRQNAFLSSWLGYFATRSGRGLYSGSRCCGTPSGKFHTTARARALPQKCTLWFTMHTRWMPPERSVFQFLPSAAACSSGVSSLHQPSFFMSTWSNSGKPVVISESFECEPSAASRLTPSLVMPKLARKQP